MGRFWRRREVGKELTTKQRLFVESYLSNGFNATEAARSAGYKAKDEHSLASIGYENLRKPKEMGETWYNLSTNRTGAEVLLTLTPPATPNLFRRLDAMPEVYTTPKLTLKQRRFIDEYLLSGNATEAARVAGYKGNRATLATVASENLAKPYIAEEVRRRDAQMRGGTTRHKRKSTRCSLRVGYVYALRADNGLVKIGRTVDIEQRLKTLHTMLPYELELLHLLPSSSIDELECYLHRYFREKRVKGEWFRLTIEDIEQLPALARGYSKR
jgi:hypothetical protein